MKIMELTKVNLCGRKSKIKKYKLIPPVLFHTIYFLYLVRFYSAYQLN